MTKYSHTYSDHFGGIKADISTGKSVQDRLCNGKMCLADKYMV